MSTAEPHLKQFELEISPLRFRFAVRAEDSLLLGFRPEGESRPRITTTPYAGHEEQVKAMLESLHWLLVANNVLDTPLNAPNGVFNPMYTKDPSVHIMIVYSDGRRWGSMYAWDSQPDNIRNLVDQVQYLAMQSLDTPSGEATATA